MCKSTVDTSTMQCQCDKERPPVDSLVRCVPSTFRVSVQKMVESHRETWWVCLDRGDRPLDAKPWDKGRITPYMSTNKEHADFTAKEFADFLGVEVSI